MNNKSVCVLRRLVCLIMGLSLVLSLFVGTAAQAVAAPGFTSLKDIQSETQQTKEQHDTDNVQPVVLGDAAIVAAITAMKTALMSTMTNLITNQVVGFMNKVLNTNITIGFKNTGETIKNEMRNVADVVAAAAQQDYADRARNQTVANVQAVKVAQGEVVAQNPITDPEVSAMKACIDYSNAQMSASGGVAGDAPVTVSSARKAELAYMREGVTNPKTGKKVRPSTVEVADSLSDKSTSNIAGGASNSVGSRNWQGPAQQRRDQSQAWINTYACEGAFAGNAGAAGLKCQDNKKADLDVRGADLLPQPGQGLTLLCFEKAAKGKYILDGYTAAFCGGQKSENLWENYVTKPGAKKMIDLSTAYVIRDYILPAGLTPFNKPFLEAMKGNNTGTEEIFAKRQAYNNAVSIVGGIYSRRIAELTPQSFGDAMNPEDSSQSAKARFDELWGKVYGATPPPPLPSQKARRDLQVEYYRSPAFIEERINTISDGAVGVLMKEQIKIAANTAGTQKDILYSLERIEMLLATMLSNDLQDRRAGIERDIKTANDRFSQGR